MAPGRPYWKGYLKLALVSCPIALYTASSSSERVSFRQINKKTGNRLRQHLVDEVTREPVESEDKGRGYEYSKGAYIQVDDDEIDATADETSTPTNGVFGTNSCSSSGLSNETADLAGKRLELLREVVPGLRRLAIMANFGYPASVLEMREVEATAGALGLEVITPEIRRAEDIAPAFEGLRERADALSVITDPLMITNRLQINTLAQNARLPAIYPAREYMESGGLISYGANYPDLFRRAAEIVDKILRGTMPSDIPIEQPTKFELIVNLKTAKTLGLTIPQAIACDRR
jgi:hypothetical protein